MNILSNILFEFKERTTSVSYVRMEEDTEIQS